MAKAIWKFRLAITDEQSVHLPTGAIPLHADEQFGEVFLWALVDPEAKAAPVRVRIVGTGHAFEDGDKWRHFATVLAHGGGFVWHIFFPKEAP